MLPRMPPPIAYLEFAGRWFGQARYDLATSGVRPVPETELAPVRSDDYAARARFVAALSERYGVAAAEIAPCLGASGAVYAACAALLGPGSRVLVERPSYEPLWRVPEGLGATVDFVERRAAHGYRLDVDEVVGALTAETRLVIITDPHNPTGVELDPAELEALGRALGRRGVFLLVDEVYRELGKPGWSARSLGDHVLACSSATKCWGLPWARAGFLFAPQELVARVATVERHGFGHAPAVSFAWGEQATRGANELVRRARATQVGQRQIVDEFLARTSASLVWQPPPAHAVYGWVRARDGSVLTEPLHRAIQSHGVVVAPGHFFGDPSAFRLSWTAEVTTVRDGLAALGHALGVTT